MRRVRVRLNARGVRALLTSSGVRDELTRRAEKVEQTAKDTAPVKTGAHRDSIHIEQDTTDRAAVRVVADTDHSTAAEASTGHMARALDEAADD